MIAEIWYLTHAFDIVVDKIVDDFLKKMVDFATVGSEIVHFFQKKIVKEIY